MTQLAEFLSSRSLFQLILQFFSGRQQLRRARRLRTKVGGRLAILDQEHVNVKNSKYQMIKEVR